MAKRHAALQTLSRQHHHGLALALRLQQGRRALLSDGWTHDLGEQRRRLQGFAREELAGHFAAEEAALFPVVASTLPRMAAEVRRLIAEHRELHALIERLGTLMEADLAQGLRECGALLERHIRFEEREFFPACERELPSDRLARLGEEIESALEQERRKHRRTLYAARQRVINAPTASLFAVLMEFARYPEWWPAMAAGSESPEGLDLMLPAGSTTVRLVVSRLVEGKSIEFLPVEGAGYARWSIMDYRGGREVRIEVNLDLPHGGTFPAGRLPEVRAELESTLEAALAALEGIVRHR